MASITTTNNTFIWHRDHMIRTKIMLTEVNTKNKQKPCNTRKMKQLFERNCALRKDYLSVAVYYISRDLHVLSPSIYIYIYIYNVDKIFINGLHVLKNNTFVRP